MHFGWFPPFIFKAMMATLSHVVSPPFTVQDTGLHRNARSEITSPFSISLTITLTSTCNSSPLVPGTRARPWGCHYSTCHGTPLTLRKTHWLFSCKVPSPRNLLSLRPLKPQVPDLIYILSSQNPQMSLLKSDMGGCSMSKMFWGNHLRTDYHFGFPLSWSLKQVKAFHVLSVPITTGLSCTHHYRTLIKVIGTRAPGQEL